MFPLYWAWLIETWDRAVLLVWRAEGTRVLYSRHGIFAYLLIIVNKFDFGQNLTVQSNF